jgi:ADP-heptose:LPS heptosyltransferase
MTHRLAVRPDSLGDVLVTGPAIRALRETCDRLTLWCGPRGRAAAELLPGVDEVVCHKVPWIAPDPDPIDLRALEEIRRDIARLHVDEAVVFTSFHQSPLPTALLLRQAGVPWVGAISEDYPGSLLDVRVRPGEVQPEPVAALELALACGGRLPEGDDGRLRILEQPPVVARSPYVVLHPGTSVPARAWPPERFREAAALLAATGLEVVVTGAPDETELTAYVAAAGPGIADLGGRTSLPGLASVLAHAEAVVVGNTGPAHLAAAVGAPIVSLFAPTVSARRWAPYAVPSVVLGDQFAPCRDTRATTCPVPGHPCLASVTAESVLAAVRQLTAERVMTR